MKVEIYTGTDALVVMMNYHTDFNDIKTMCEGMDIYRAIVGMVDDYVLLAYQNSQHWKFEETGSKEPLTANVSYDTMLDYVFNKLMLQVKENRQ
jgi:hypothetical protein